jgi:hypothetical protein
MRNMKKTSGRDSAPCVGHHLKIAVRVASFGVLFFSLLGTGVAWAGADSFNCSAVIWKTSLALGLIFSLFAWLVYLPFRNTDQLLGNGLLSIFFFLCLFWLFGFAGFYFYFLVAPINVWLRTIALSGVTVALLYRMYIITCDIREAFQVHENLFDRMYCDEGTSITFTRQAVGFLEQARKNRNPFKSIHAYAAMIVAPFVLVLNKLLTPVLGDGHGVFLVSAFFSVPILLWGVEIFVQTIVTMIYYPIKLQRETGKPVLMKDW